MLDLSPVRIKPAAISFKSNIEEKKSAIQLEAEQYLPESSSLGTFFHNIVFTRFLDEYIDFSPARSLLEAEDFAKKQLKIRGYHLRDLESANYVNEALVNYNNNISSDHRRIIDEVFPSTEDDPGFASITLSKFENILNFNEEEFGRFDRELEDFIAQNKPDLSPNGLRFIALDKKQAELIQKANTKEKRALLNKKETLDAYRLITRISEFQNGLANGNSFICWFSILLSDPKNIELLKSLGLPSTLQDFLRTKSNDKLKICLRLAQEYDKKYQIITGGTFEPINHEIGHALHKNNIGIGPFERLTYTKQPEMNFLRAQKRFIQEIGHYNTILIHSNLGSYALVDPVEFAAEVYAALCDGVKLPEPIMNLYRQYGGVIPKNFK